MLPTPEPNTESCVSRQFIVDQSILDCPGILRRWKTTPNEEVRDVKGVEDAHERIVVGIITEPQAYFEGMEVIHAKNVQSSIKTQCGFLIRVHSASTNNVYGGIILASTFGVSIVCKS